jgi:hypothetical protein
MEPQATNPTVQERERTLRRGIMRSAAIWTPLFLALIGLWVFFLWDRLAGPEYGSTWFLMVVLTIFGVLFGVQSISALRDLLGKPREESGIVSRQWTKRDSFVWKSYYIRMGRRILRGDEELLGSIRAGDHVQARFFTHSAILIDLTKLEPPAQPEPEPAEEEGDPATVVVEPSRPRGRASRPEF